jgi:hypothetical protein
MAGQCVLTRTGTGVLGATADYANAVADQARAGPVQVSYSCQIPHSLGGTWPCR